MRYLGSLLVLISACAQSLPELPTGDEGPSQIQIKGLSDALSGDPLDPTAIFVGTPLRVEIEIRSNTGPLAGSGVRLSVQQQDFLERFRFPEGDACTTNPEGHCSILVISTGTAGEVTFTARANARPDLSTTLELKLVPDERQLSIRFDLGASGIVDWQQGRVDPLPTAAPFSIIANGEAVQLKIQVLGQQGNPIDGIEVHASAPVVPANEAVPVRLHSSAGGTCGAPLAEPQAVARTGGEAGWAILCLSGGERIGPWTLKLTLPGRIHGDHLPGSPDGSFALQGSTRSADPALIRAIDATEADLEPTIRCEPGLVSPPIRFEALDAEGRPASGVAILLNGNALELIGNPIQVTNASGQIHALVQCPISLPTPVALQASLVDHPVVQARAWVALWAQPVHQLTARAGDEDRELGRAEPGEPFSIIIEARDRQSSLVPETRLDLQLVRWSGASALRLAQEGQCNPEGDGLPEFSLTDGREEINGTANPAYGTVRLDLCAYGPATVARPITLVVKVHGQELRQEIPVLLEPGPPTTVLTEPAEQIAVLLGGNFGPLAVHVRDAAGNGVADAAITLSPPDGLMVSPSSGYTNPLGRFNFLITGAETAGELSLGVRAEKGEDFDQTTQLTVTVGAGTPHRIRLLRAGRVLMNQAGAVNLQVPIGERLVEPITLRLENEVGGGMAGLGLSAVAAGDQPEGCGQIGPDNMVTDDGGQVILGGDHGVVLAAGHAVTLGGDDHCEFNLQHGAVIQPLRIIQTPGPPVGGSLEAVVDDGPEQFLAHQSPPAEFSAQNSQAIRLSVNDALGNPKVGLRVWLNVTNCWTDERIQLLDAQGQATWRVAGGRNHARPCVIQPAIAEPWPQAPTLNLELDGYPLPELNGLRIATAADNGPGFTLHNTTFFRLEDAAASTRFHLDLADGYAPIRPADLDGLPGECFRADQAEGGGDPYQGCTKAELWTVDINAEGDLNRSKVRDLPIDAVAQDGGWIYFTEVDHADLGDGRELEIRLVEPNGEVGDPVQIYAHPPHRWTELTPGGLAVPILVGANAGDLKILGGQRHQLDDDPFLEAVLCGVDDRGGWVQVMDQEGEAFRFHGHRTWSHGPNPVSPYAPQVARLACPLTDLDGDGDLDLAQPTGTHANYLLPRIAFLPGTGSAPFFAAPTEVPFTAGQLNQPLIQLDFTGPPQTLWFADGGGRAGEVALQQSPFAGDPEGVFGQVDLGDNGSHFNRVPFDTARLPGIGGMTTYSWSSSGFHYRTSIFANQTLPGGPLLPPNTDAARPLRVPPEAGHASIDLWTMDAEEQTIALLLSDNTVRFIDAITWKLKRTLQRPDEGHTGFRLSADHQTVVSSDGEEVLVWDVNSGLIFARLPGYRPAIDSGGRWLALLTGPNQQATVQLYDLLAPEAPQASWASEVDSPELALAPGGERIAVAGCDELNCRLILLDQELTPLRQWPECGGGDSNQRVLAFSPDGNSLFCNRQWGSLQAYDLYGERRYILPGGPRMTAGMSPLQKEALYGLDGCGLHRLRDGFKLVELGSWKCARPFFSADGSWAASHKRGDGWNGISLFANSPWAEGTVNPTLEDSEIGRSMDGYHHVTIDKLLGQGAATDRFVVTYGQQDLRVRTLSTWRRHCGNGRLDSGETIDEGQPWEGTGRDVHCGAD